MGWVWCWSAQSRVTFTIPPTSRLQVLERAERAKPSVGGTNQTTLWPGSEGNNSKPWLQRACNKTWVTNASTGQLCRWVICLAATATYSCLLKPISLMEKSNGNPLEFMDYSMGHHVNSWRPLLTGSHGVYLSLLLQYLQLSWKRKLGIYTLDFTPYIDTFTPI